MKEAIFTIFQYTPIIPFLAVFSFNFHDLWIFFFLNLKFDLWPSSPPFFAGNTVANDGCSTTCAIESGWVCTGSPSICNNCGNGKRENPEECDLGTTNPGNPTAVNGALNSGCTAQCKIAAGYKCTYVPAGPDVCFSGTELCGDGKISSFTELCDDGNKVSGDGCSSACAIESGWGCTGGTASTPSQCFNCGNGKVESVKETCDDGNAVGGDGCSATCITEPGFSCSTAMPNVCQMCGNSKREGNEQCDDGNTADFDGCSTVCTTEAGWTCNGVALGKSTCQRCGNGIKEGTEQCDDTNVVSGDGCSATCTTESGWTCDAGSPTKCK
jgi:cysteine-rich repeat protein